VVVRPRVFNAQRSSHRRQPNFTRLMSRAKSGPDPFRPSTPLGPPSTRCSRKTASMRRAPKRGIPRPRSIRDRRLKRKYGGRKSQQTQNKNSLQRRARKTSAHSLEISSGMFMPDDCYSQRRFETCYRGFPLAVLTHLVQHSLALLIPARVDGCYGNGSGDKRPHGIRNGQTISSLRCKRHR
jgi:hypothetical protein